MKIKKVIAVLMFLAACFISAFIVNAASGGTCMCFDWILAEETCVQWCSTQGSSCYGVYPDSAGSCGEYDLKCTRTFWVYCNDGSHAHYLMRTYCPLYCNAQSQ